MDLFKRNNIEKSTAYDFYVSCVPHTKMRSKDKKMLHKTARSRVRKQTDKDFKEVYEEIIKDLNKGV